jgi:tetratricopeptide (TPR) repeat protein
MRRGAMLVYNDGAASIQLFLRAYELSEQIEDTDFKARSLASLGEAFAFGGNPTKGVETTINALSLAQSYADKRLLNFVNLKLASVYIELGHYDDAIKYAERTQEDADSSHIYKWGILARAYSLQHNLDSALYYGQKTYQLSLSDRSDWGSPYHVLGSIHLELGHTPLSLEFYRMGLTVKPYVIDSIVCLIGIANVYNAMGSTDSVHFYANRALEKARESKFPQYLATSYGLLKNIHKQKGNLDSAFIYQEQMVNVKDSIFATEKLKAVQNLKFNEQLREIQDRAAEKKAKEERDHYIQYGVIGIALVTLIILFFSISQTILVKEKFINFAGLVGLLLVFEFVNVISHPIVGSLTHHSPIGIYLVMVCIAALLVPVHQRMEHWISRQLVERNKRVRLAAARKTISELDSGNIR